MLKALWFFTQIAIIAAGAIWLVNRPGRVSMDIMEYTIGMQTGHFLLTLFIVFFLLLFVFRFMRGILSLPHAVSNIREKDKRVKGMQALTKGLVAVAAGDSKKATQFSKQTKQYMPKQTGLPVLLEAQAARMRGDEVLAKRCFQNLLKDKDTAFLGVRGLLKHAVEENDYNAALGYALEANKLHPKQGWILEGLYDLQIKNRKWHDALSSLQKLKKNKKISDDKAQSDQVAIYHALYLEAKSQDDKIAALKYLDKAYKANPTFVPSVTMLADIALQQNRRTRAHSLIKKAWKANPHPDLLLFWERLTPSSKKKQAEKTMKWYEELVALNPQSAEGQMAAARVAMDRGLWGEAKAYLKMAERLMPTSTLYKLLAQVEQNSSENDHESHQTLEKAAAALPDKVWVCAETGMIYESWEPIAEPHSSFNTIIWDYPHSQKGAFKSGVFALHNHEALLIDPAA